MRIRYETTLDDILALNRYHLEHSPASRRALAIWQAAPILIGLVYFIVMTFVTGEPGVAIGGVVVVVIGGAFWLLVTPILYRRKMTKAVRSTFGESKNSGAVGRHEIELADDGLHHRNEYVESRMSYAAVEQVISDGGYTFVYFGASASYVIPHAAVTEGDPEAFADALRQKLADTSPAAG